MLSWTSIRIHWRIRKGCVIFLDSFLCRAKEKRCISAFICIKDEHLHFYLTKFSRCLTFFLLCSTMAAPILIRFCILLPVCLSSILAAIDEISINQQESWPRLASSSSSANEAAQNINDTLTSGSKMKRKRKKLR